MHETVLTESRTMRAHLADRTDVLEKVGRLRLSPDGMFATSADLVEYFEVGETTIRSLVHDHRGELIANGYRVLTGAELSSFKELCGTQLRVRSLAVFPRRAVLNVAMLLRESIVARQVRTYLLDAEQDSRPRHASNPVDNSGEPAIHSLLDWLSKKIEQTVSEQLPEVIHRLVPTEARIRQIAGEAVREVLETTVLPLLNQSLNEHSATRRRLDQHSRELTRLNRVLMEHQAWGSHRTFGDLDK